MDEILDEIEDIADRVNNVRRLLTKRTRVSPKRKSPTPEKRKRSRSATPPERRKRSRSPPARGGRWSVDDTIFLRCVNDSGEQLTPDIVNWARKYGKVVDHMLHDSKKAAFIKFSTRHECRACLDEREDIIKMDNYQVFRYDPKRGGY